MDPQNPTNLQEPKKKKNEANYITTNNNEIYENQLKKA